MGSCGELNIINTYFFKDNKLIKSERKVNSELALRCYGSGYDLIMQSYKMVRTVKSKKMQADFAKQKLESEKLFTDELLKRIQLLLQK